MRRLVLVVLAALCSSAAAPRVFAAPVQRVDLVWTRDDPTCIDEAALAATVEHALGRAVFHAAAQPGARVEGHATAEDGRHDVHVAIVSDAGVTIAERTVTTTGDCRRLDESVAVVVALMIDGIEEAPGPLLIPAEPPRPLPAPAPVAQRTAPIVPPPSLPAPKLGLALGLGGGGTISLLPTLTPFVMLRGEVDPPELVPISLAVRAHASSDARVDAVGGAFEAWSGEVAMCPLLRRPDFRLAICVGAGGGVLTGLPIGLSAPHGAMRPLAFGLAMPSASVRLGRAIWLRAEAGAFIPFLRESWGFVNADGGFVEVHRVGALVPVTSLVTEVRIDP